jgi:hypothetical protein
VRTSFRADRRPQITPLVDLNFGDAITESQIRALKTRRGLRRPQKMAG